MARGKKKKTAEKSAPGKEKNTLQQTEGGSPERTNSELQEHVTPTQTIEEVNTSQKEPPKCEQQGCGRVATCTVTVEIGEDLNAPTTAEAWACDDCATNAHLNSLVIASFQPLTALTTLSPVETEEEEVVFKDSTVFCEAGFCTNLPDVSISIETQDCNIQTLNVCNEHNSEEALQAKRIISTKPYDSITVPPSEYSVSLQKLQQLTLRTLLNKSLGNRSQFLMPRKKRKLRNELAERNGTLRYDLLEPPLPHTELLELAPLLTI